MNKKKFARILSMYRDGVEVRICIEMIISLSTSNMMASIWIEKLLDKIIGPLLMQSEDLSEAVIDLGNNLDLVPTMKGEKTNEPSKRPRSTNVENNRPNET